MSQITSAMATGSHDPSQIVDNLQNAMQDPVSLEIVRDPLVLYCGHSFDQSTVLEILRRRNVCPLCKERIEGHVRNHQFRALIECVSRCSIVSVRVLQGLTAQGPDALRLTDVNLSLVLARIFSPETVDGEIDARGENRALPMLEEAGPSDAPPQEESLAILPSITLLTQCLESGGITERELRDTFAQFVLSTGRETGTRIGEGIISGQYDELLSSMSATTLARFKQIVGESVDPDVLALARAREAEGAQFGRVVGAASSQADLLARLARTERERDEAQARSAQLEERSAQLEEQNARLTNENRAVNREVDQAREERDLIKNSIRGGILVGGGTGMMFSVLSLGYPLVSWATAAFTSLGAYGGGVAGKKLAEDRIRSMQLIAESQQQIVNAQAVMAQMQQLRADARENVAQVQANIQEGQAMIAEIEQINAAHPQDGPVVVEVAN